MKIMTKILAILLVVCMLIPLCACKKEKLPEKQIVENVYKITTTPIPEPIEYLNSLVKAGDGYIAYAEMKDEEMGYKSAFVKLDNNLNFVSELEVDYGDMPEGDRYINMLCTSPDGSSWAIINMSSYDEKTGFYESWNYIVHFDQNFKVIEYFDINDVIKADEENGRYSYINRLTVDNKGNLVFLANQAFYYADDKCNILFEKNFEDMNISYIQSMINTDKGIIIFYDDTVEYKRYAAIFDPETKNFGEPIDMGGNYGNAYPASGGYDFYYNDSNALYGYKLETGESEEVMNFLNSDVMSFYATNFILGENGDFYSTGWDETGDYDNGMVLNHYVPVPDGEVKPKYIITLGALYTDYRIRQQIFKFNRTSEEYRITIKDYSEGIDYSENSEYTYEDAIAKMNGDIASGNVPDLFICGSELPFDSYASKGLFEDLYKFMDNDPEYDRSKFEANVLKAFETKDKLYRMVPSYSIITFAAKPDVLGDAAMNNWNMDAFLNIARNLPEGSQMIQDGTRDQVLSMFINYMYRDFVDTSTGKCSFDNGDFEKILEYVATLPTTSMFDNINWDEITDEFWQDQENAFAEGRVVLSQTWLDGFQSMESLVNYTFKTRDFEFVGFPTGKNGGGVISADGQSIAISSKSKFKDGAWEFMKMLLSEDYQNNLDYTFPVRTASLEKMMQEALDEAAENKKEWEEMQNGGNGIIGGGAVTMIPREAVAVADFANPVTPIEREQRTFLDEELANRVLECVRKTDTVMQTDTEVSKIITEEANRFFEGQCNARDAAMSIQSRASIYIGENS